MLTNTTIAAGINSPVRQIKTQVVFVLDDGTTLHFRETDRVKSFTVDRVGEGKFIGYGICQRINIKLIDKDRELTTIHAGNKLYVFLGTNGGNINPFPHFYITEIHRDENTNEMSITGYDKLYDAATHTTSEITINEYTIKELATECGKLIGLSTTQFIGVDDATLNIAYSTGANFEGTETIRDALNAIAEATQTIYYVYGDYKLIFKRLDKDGEAVYTIDRNRYYTLKNSDNRRVSAVCHATELGDNVSADTGVTGTVIYIRDNPLWELRDDIADLVDNALIAVGGLTVNQFECEWRGNFLLEIGDKIALITKDNETVYSYVLDDVIEYDGTLKQNTKWSYTQSDAETESNPTNLGELIKQTYARVDKANKNIELMVSEIDGLETNMSNLVLTTEGIAATVSNTTKTVDDLTEDVETLMNKVSTQISSEDVKILIEKTISNEVTSVTTNTGFTFNDEGLTVSKSDSEMKTQITDDGMTVFKNDEAVLVADNEGVKAANLHATTFLIIGKNSRFEDYDNRTGCFWIGG